MPKTIIARVDPTLVRRPPSDLEKALLRLADEAEKNMIFVPVALSDELDAALKQARRTLKIAERDRLPFS